MSRKITQDEQEKADVDGSHMFAFVWQMMKRKLPYKIVADIEGFAAKTGIPLTDGVGKLYEPCHPKLQAQVQNASGKMTLADKVF